MKPNHHIHASTWATSPARHTSSTRFLSKILAALAVSLFAFMLATPEAKAEPEANAKVETEVKKTQDLLAMMIPQITLCASLQKLDSRWEVRGKNHQEIVDALKTSDDDKIYHAIIDAYKATTMAAPPRRGSVSKASLKILSFPLFLETTFKSSGDGKALFFIRLESEGWPSLTSRGKWEEHPDGIGYIYQWSPGDTPGLIVAATQKERAAFFKAIEDYQKEQIDQVRKNQQRVQLGDMTKEEARQKYEQIHEETQAAIWAKALKWAATETKPEINPETKTEDELKGGIRVLDDPTQAVQGLLEKMSKKTPVNPK